MPGLNANSLPHGFWFCKARSVFLVTELYVRHSVSLDSDVHPASCLSLPEHLAAFDWPDLFVHRNPCSGARGNRRPGSPHFYIFFSSLYLIFLQVPGAERFVTGRSTGVNIVAWILQPRDGSFIVGLSVRRAADRTQSSLGCLGAVMSPRMLWPGTLRRCDCSGREHLRLTWTA